jgi:hypothetical protein
MAIPPPESLDWPSDRAVLLVHGIGNAGEGDYAALKAQIAEILSHADRPYAIYVLYYDYLNDWFAAKEQVGRLNHLLRDELRRAGPPERTWNTTTEFVGDVLWPVLVVDARVAIQTAIRSQLLQMIRDGQRTATKVMPDGSRRKIRDVADLHLSIIAHSMGCFHTYEALHAIARDPGSGMQPATDGVQFDNVILMASPVAMIGTIARSVRKVVPSPDGLYCLATPHALPQQKDPAGTVFPTARRPVSITGKLDPVGGWWLTKMVGPWHMDLSGDPTAVCIDDSQNPLNINTVADLDDVISRSLQGEAKPIIGDRHPHSWGGYVTRHAKDLRTWLDVP